MALNYAQGGNGGQGGSGIYSGNGGNNDDAEAGGLNAWGGTVNLSNTLIAENTVTPGSGASAFYPDIFGVISSSDHDLIDDGSGCNLWNGENGDQVGTDANRINPMLYLLSNYDGPTQTMPLMLGSPAIDAGDPTVVGLPATDQRGYARIAGTTIDIGAVEAQGGSANADLSVSSSASSSVPPGGLIIYTLIVTNNGPSAQNFVTLTDSLPANTTLVSWTVPGGWSSAAPAAGSGSGTVSAWFQGLSSGASASFTLVLQVNSATPIGTVLSNTASVGPVIGDPNPANNSVTSSTIVQATPTVTANGGTYNGNPFPATATAVGVDGTTPVSGSVSYTYYAGIGTTGTNLGSTAPTNADTYTVVANFTSSDPNYSNGTAQTTFTISPSPISDFSFESPALPAGSYQLIRAAHTAENKWPGRPRLDKRPVGTAAKQLPPRPGSSRALGLRARYAVLPIHRRLSR